MYFVAPICSAAASFIKPLASCIYSLVNQGKETLRNDVGFATVYRRIYCRKFVTLSKSDVALHMQVHQNRGWHDSTTVTCTANRGI